MAVAHAGKQRHPKGLPVLFLTEMWERFSFYLMLAILALYMNASPDDGGLGFSSAKTGQIFGLYIGIVYFTPLFGGIIADRLLGIRRTVMLGGAFFILGHLLLAFPPVPFFYAGLTALVIGNGLFKPNISTMLGNLYRNLPEKKDDGYNIFYLGINLGAFLSPLVAAWTRSQFGWHAAFATAAAGMVISMVIFVMFQRLVKDGDVGPAASKLDHKDDDSVRLDPVTTRKRVSALIVVFLVVIVFWLAFNQQGLTLTFWARNASQTVLPPELFSSINPFFILTLTFPLIALWQSLRARGKEPSTAAKLAIGMALTSLAYLVMMTAGLQGGDDGKVGIYWLTSAYAIITTGELCLSPMGLSLVSKLAPPRMMGMMMGGWFVATAIGGYLAGAVGGALWGNVANSSFFLILAIAAAVVFVIALLLLKWLDPIIHQAERDAAISAGGDPDAHDTSKRGNPILIAIAMVGIAAVVGLFVTWYGSRDKVETFVDGNTVELGWARHAHLVGVWEIEELLADSTRMQDILDQATAEFGGETVHVVYANSELSDHSNDIHGYLEIGGTDLGAWMISSGFAVADTNLDHPRRDRYMGLQNEAKREGRGYWYVPPAEEEQPMLEDGGDSRADGR